MRLLAVTHSLERNGAAVCLVDALLHLRQQGWAIDLLHSGKGALSAPLHAVGIRTSPHLNRHDYDLALVNTMMDARWIPALAPHLPCVLWAHEGRMVLPPGQADLGAWRRTLAQADRLVFQTPWQAREVLGPGADALAPGQLVLLPNGLPAWAMAPVACAPPTQPTVAWTGVVCPRKRPADLAAAVLTLGDMGAICRFTGDASHLHLLPERDQALFAQHPTQLRLLGEASREDTVARVAAAHAFCLPSEDESFPLSCLEAAAQGRPLVLTDLPCYQGIWQHGVNALLSPVGDVAALARHLRAVLTDAALAARLGAAARLTALRHRQEAQHQALQQTLLAAVAGRVPRAEAQTGNQGHGVNNAP